ncbi:MAG: hypothetical protein DCF25_19750 [Leptolyngbya foveolarum]|uniref:Uncharacterized protein n=1 Tax=Leptolyngbya foveolarum TaxID=47253 RepID=A0A2W4VWJ5_9CYAN|nr:MAG: hypothetical protein DCF25_19750 [Leptolyngbya foveolarum]
MTERLDRIEQQQERNSADIGDLLSLTRDLLQVAASNADAITQMREQIADGNQRFDVLRADAIADREEWRTRADADRAENARRFDAVQENIQRLFLELNSTNRRVENLEQAS